MELNDTLKTIAERHSNRLFDQIPVDEELLKIVLTAANQAPSAHNQQSWRFIVLRNEKKTGLAHMISEDAVNYPKTSATLLRMASRTILSAPAVIAIVNTGELINHGKELLKIDHELSYDFFRTMEIQSSAAAVQNLLLAATSLGLSTVWLGIMYLIKEKVLSYLNEPPEGEFMAIIPIGYSAKKTTGPKKRTLEMIVRYED